MCVCECVRYIVERANKTGRTGSECGEFLGEFMD